MTSYCKPACTYLSIIRSGTNIYKANRESDAKENGGLSHLFPDFLPCTYHALDYAHYLKMTIRFFYDYEMVEVEGKVLIFS